MFVSRIDYTSWGRVIKKPQRVARPRFRIGLAQLERSPATRQLAVGLRRSYGDLCLNSAGNVIDMTGLDRLIAFDSSTGNLTAEAGISLSSITRFAVPRGFFLPTTPGTRFVTLGGAVANDVHGKNHHRVGSFGNHIGRVGLRRTDGSTAILSRQDNTEMFAATIGGLGLTGIIEWVEVTLTPIPSSGLDVEILPYGSLNDFWALAAESADSHEHTVAWFDGLSSGKGTARGVFSRANWARDGALQPHCDKTWKSIPVNAPRFLLNKFTLGLVNNAYYLVNRLGRKKLRQHYSSFFYPLDAIQNWNRLYGRPGFYQYQFVVPRETQQGAIQEAIRQIARSGLGSFLAVLKSFGAKASEGLLSFPTEGTTLAIDFPNRGNEVLSLFKRLDDVVREGKGRLYPAKDGRMSRDMFRSSFPAWPTFLRHVDPGLESDFWQRVKP